MEFSLVRDDGGEVGVEGAGSAGERLPRSSPWQRLSWVVMRGLVSGRW
jgi:hypothetical protein